LVEIRYASSCGVIGLPTCSTFTLQFFRAVVSRICFQVTQYFILFINTFGAMAICTLLYGLMQRGISNVILLHLGVGLVLGCGGIAVMVQPVILASGVQIDARGAFVGMAAAFGGPIAAGVAVALTVAARAAIGGIGVIGGSMVIVATALGAVIWRIALGNSRTWTAWLSICLICAVPSAFTLFAVLGGVSPSAIFLSVLISMIVVIFGKMLETEQRRGQRERELAKEAATDSLTDLPNRRALEIYVRQLEQEQATGLLFLLLDVDHFKRINDDHGHDAGDAVLREIGSAIRRTIRDTDFAARVGGEELAIIVRAGSQQAGYLVAERFRTALRVPFGAGQQTQVSIGGYFIGREPFNYGEAYRQADQALYASKRHGRDRVTLFSAEDEALQLAS